jgi:hypothetical protein
MTSLLKFLSLRCLAVLLCLPFPLFVHAQAAERSVGSAAPATVEWSTPHAQHVYGLPEAKIKDKGALSITAIGLSFHGEMSNTTIPLATILAAGSGNERVELWGLKGQILRAVMPNSSGLLAATVMHHRVDMFTVEFVGANGGYHAAVFFLPAHDADRAVKTLSALPVQYHQPLANVCEKALVQPKTIRMPQPEWSGLTVPAVYRALLYEHMVDELRKSGQFERVYRDGEEAAGNACAQYTARLSVTGFKPGNQVERASLGPVGMFVGTTQMVFDASIRDADGRMDFHEQVKATVRGESQNTKVSESIAKKFVKKFVKWRRQPSPVTQAGVGEAL